MAPPKRFTAEELKERKRLGEKRRREKRRNDPVLQQEDKIQQHLRYEKRKEMGLKLLISEMSDRSKRTQKKIWKEQKRKSRAKQKIIEKKKTPQPPTSAGLPAASGLSRKKAGRKPVCRYRSKVARDLVKQKEENKKLKTLVSRYKSRYQRAMKKLSKLFDSPNTKNRHPKMNRLKTEEEWLEDVETETDREGVAVVSDCSPSLAAIKEEPDDGAGITPGFDPILSEVDLKEERMENVLFENNAPPDGVLTDIKCEIEVADYFGSTTITNKEEPEDDESGLVGPCAKRDGDPGIDLPGKAETQDPVDTSVPAPLMLSSPESQTTAAGHLRVFVTEKPFSCEQCDYRCARASMLKVHMMNHTGERPFSCELCQYKTNVASSLKIHMKTHTGERPFVCEVCECRFSTKSTLTVHMRRHSGDRPYACEECDFRTISSSNLNKHKMRLHSGVVELIRCSSCELTFKDARTLKRHEKKVHSDDWPHTCQVCGHKAIRAASLRVHMITHTGEKRHACDLCDFRAFKFSALKIHMRTHSGEKPFGCALCDYKCIVKGRLKNHMRTHTGEKPYLCSVCDYRTSVKSSLQLHMMIHTGEKPYSCALCVYRTVTTKQLKNHMKNHAK